MNKIRGTFLGTGTSVGVPMVACECEVCLSTDARNHRTRTAFMFETGGKTIVVDTGPDFRQQMLQAKVKALDAVLITHAHNDHFIGMDDIRAFNFHQKTDMHVYATVFVQDTIKRVFDYVFRPVKYPGVPSINLETISKEPFDVAGISVIPIEVLHHKLPVLGFRIGDVTYITDANYIAPEEKEKIKGSKILIVNALRREKHISHFTLEEALDLAKEINAEHTYFTHISHQLGLYEDIAKELPANVSLAYDGLSFEV